MEGDISTALGQLLAPVSRQRLHTLSHCAILLSLVHTRNRNQHRQSHWYRHFSCLRRETIQLCRDLAISLPVNLSSFRRLRKFTYRKGGNVTTRPNKQRAVCRLLYWSSANLPVKWYLALSQLIATSQHASIGLVLMAVLAKVCSIVGMTTALKRGEQKLAKDLEHYDAVFTSLADHSSDIEKSEPEQLGLEFVPLQSEQMSTIDSTASEPLKAKFGDLKTGVLTERSVPKRRPSDGKGTNKKKRIVSDRGSIDALFASL